MSWALEKFANLGEFKNGVNFKATASGTGYPLINVKDITDHHWLNESKLQLVDINVSDDYFSKKDDIFFVRSSVKRDGIGLVGKFNLEPKHTIHCGFVIRFRPDPVKLDSEFLLYLLKSYTYREKLKNLSSGAAHINLSQSALKTLEIPIPNLKEQRAVAQTIKTYDNLIENNKRRIELLEESARQLYKEWFVRFRFPGHEHVNMIDGVPEGWVVKPLSKIAGLTMGQSPKSEFYNIEGNGIPFHQGVTKFGFRYIEHKTFCTKPTRLSLAEDILFSVRAPVGRINITNDVIALGRGLAAIRSIEGFQSFLFYALKSYFFKEDMIGGGAIYASVTKKDLENQELLIPLNSLLVEFDEFASDVDQQILKLHKMNVNLTKARDLLLPKLMSGQIAI